MSAPATLSKDELIRNITQLNKSIADADSSMSAANREMVLRDLGNCLCCLFLCCGAIAIVLAGAALQAEGVNNLNRGNFGTGVIDIWAGMNVVSMGTNVAGAALSIPAANSSWNAQQTYEYYSRHRTRLDATRTSYQKQVYEMEKAETLGQLNENHPFHAAVTRQFAAMDENIRKGTFSPAYTDIAANTKNIITAKPGEDQNRYLDMHMKLATKKSVGKQVAGLMLGVVGIVLLTVSIFAAAASLGVSTPLSALGIILGMSALTSALSITAGAASLAATAGAVGLFQSGLTRRRTSVPQEVIELANANHQPEPLQQPALKCA